MIHLFIWSYSWKSQSARSVHFSSFLNILKQALSYFYKTLYLRYLRKVLSMPMLLIYMLAKLLFFLDVFDRL